MVALSAFNPSTGGLAIGDWIYSAKPLAAPAYLPLNNDEASYLSSSYPTLAAIHAPTAVSYSAVAKTFAPNAVTFVSSAYGNGTYAFLTAGGTVWTTTDFSSWVCTPIEAQPPSYTANSSAIIGGQGGWSCITYGKGRFVVVRTPPNFANTGASYGGSAVSFDNGLTWKLGVISNTAFYNYGYTNVSISWSTVTYANGVFMAFGSHYDQVYGYYYTDYARSNDGIYWEYQLQNIQAGGTLALALKCAASTTRIVFIVGNRPYYVPIGTFNAVAGNQFPGVVKSVAFGAGIFVTVGSDGSNANTTSYGTSTDGYTWVNRTLPASLNWTSIEFSNGYFVAIGQNTTGSGLTQNAIATSTDGINWTLRAAATSVYTRGVMGSGNGKFFYVNETNGTTGDLISISAAASTFSLPFIPAIGGTQTFMKAT